jgi:hypothetical protein
VARRRSERSITRSTIRLARTNAMPPLATRSGAPGFPDPFLIVRRSKIRGCDLEISQDVERGADAYSWHVLASVPKEVPVKHKYAVTEISIGHRSFFLRDLPRISKPVTVLFCLASPDVIRTHGRRLVQEYRLRLNGHRLYYITSLCEVSYESTIQVSRNFHALFYKDLREFRY